VTFHHEINSHDAVVNVPNPLLEEAVAEGAKAPTFEIVKFTKAGGPLTKRIFLNDDGSTTSDGTACTMPRGVAERIPLAGIAELATLVAELRPDQAIALGALRWDLPDQVSVVTKNKLNGHAETNVIARTGANIDYRAREAGFALCDYDTKGISSEVEAKLKSHGTYWRALCEVVPGLTGAAHVTRRSTSAGLLRTDTGEKLPGSRGIHVYIAVKDSSDIERFLKTLHERCWLAGYGWMMVGKAGQLLERSIVDRMVGAPERLVFEGKPVLVPPLDQDQDARRPVAADGEMVDTVEVCPPLTLLERARLADMQAKARHAIAGEAAKARAAFIDAQADEIVKRTGMPRASAKAVVAKQCDGHLLPTVELPFDDQELAGHTVADVLDNPTRYEGETLADPLQGVELGKCRAKIMLRPDGTPWITSFAHGRTTYDLKLDAAAVQAAMDAESDEDEVLSILVRLAHRASLDPAETDKLITLAHKRTEIGKRAIKQMLKDAQAERDGEQRQAERDRRMAEREDPRPLIRAPKNDAEWGPVVRLILDVLASQTGDEPPMRNRDGMLVQRRVRKAMAMHAFVCRAANGEAEGDDTKLPPPDQHLLTVLDEVDTARLIEKYIEYYVESEHGERSVHLPSVFVPPVMKGLPDDLPVVDAVATLPLVMPNGALLAGPGLDRDHGILFKIDPGIQRLMPRPRECDSDRVTEAMRFLTEEWLCDVATNYAGKCILIAAAMTIIERTLFPERPDFYVTAGRRGGGKTTALTMLIMAVMGARPSAAAWTSNDEERKKALFSYLMDGVAYILWDNIQRGTLIDCQHIQKASTSDSVTDRILGVSKTASASSAAIQLFTGNNIGPKGDSVSRALQARIEVDRIDPENRPFRHSDPIGWTEANRPKILRALYTIMLGNPELKKPRGAPAKTRFKLWWRVVGAAIENAAGLHSKAIDPAAYDAEDRSRPFPVDFKRLFISQESDDEDNTSLADVLDILNRRWPVGTFKAADVAGLINENGTTPDGAAVRELLFPNRKGDQTATSKSVGKRLAMHIGNPVMHGERTLTLCCKIDGKTKNQTFFVKEVVG
jgi:hypothetical protein